MRFITTPISDTNELRERIIWAFQFLSADMNAQLMASYKRRLRYCIDVQESSVEQNYED